MLSQIIYLVFALTGLGFLIFIHELGHYWMARRAGMRVEAFAIGFGTPLFTWVRDGVEWRICWLPFGGYVKIAGTEVENGKEPYEIADGFFGRGPWNTIKVAVMGPLANLVFALFAFAVLWGMGGREKSFSQYTQRAGWVDTKSELYKQGVRPGDLITAYNGNSVSGAKDHFYAPMLNSDQLTVEGFHVEEETGVKKPFSYTVKPYQHPDVVDEGLLTVGVLGGANYLIYNRLPNGEENTLPEGSPMVGSGLQYGDRVIWMDGVEIYSLVQLREVLNDGRALLTVQRGGQVFLARVPRVVVEEIRLSEALNAELTDWQFASDLKQQKLGKLKFIPYNLSSDCVVEEQLRLIDPEMENEMFPAVPYSNMESALVTGDRIVAVDGVAVQYSHELFSGLQRRQVHIVVERGQDYSKPIDWKLADDAFSTSIDLTDLNRIAQSIGTSTVLKSSGNLVLLNPVQPVPRSAFPLAGEEKERVTLALLKHKKKIEEIEDLHSREIAMKQLEEMENQLLLGVPGIQDRKISYNPNPFQAFKEVFTEVAQTFTALVTGYLNPKWLSGPIGIVSMIQTQWGVGIKEVIFWMGMISLNLGVLNLLPVPVLDGGYICLGLLEIVTGIRLKAKTLERLVLPFAVLLIGLFIFLTFHDLSRLIRHLFG
jgi:regulator of sigma E protease